jgi:NTP pyrophosphatase (non-canonical NTP hydrolase)
MPLDVAVQGLCSEAGEVAGLVKKVWERDMPISMAQMLSELGDVALYLSVLAQRFGFSMEEVWAANVDKLERRFPER